MDAKIQEQSLLNYGDVTQQPSSLHDTRYLELQITLPQT